jgi:hypothetical protein
MKSKSSRPTKPRNPPKDSDAPPPDRKDDLDASVGVEGVHEVPARESAASAKCSATRAGVTKLQARATLRDHCDPSLSSRPKRKEEWNWQKC